MSDETPTSLLKNLGKLKKQQLQEAAATLGLATEGTADELRERLRSAQASSSGNLGSNNSTGSTSNASLPHLTTNGSSIPSAKSPVRSSRPSLAAEPAPLSVPFDLKSFPTSGPLSTPLMVAASNPSNPVTPGLPSASRVSAASVARRSLAGKGTGTEDEDSNPSNSKPIAKRAPRTTREVAIANESTTLLALAPPVRRPKGPWFFVIVVILCELYVLMDLTSRSPLHIPFASHLYSPSPQDTPSASPSFSSILFSYFVLMILIPLVLTSLQRGNEHGMTFTLLRCLMYQLCAPRTLLEALPESAFWTGSVVIILASLHEALMSRR